MIDTKPNTPKKEVEIKPSKTQVLSADSPPVTTKKVSSVVQVQSNQSPSIATKVDVKPSVKINVIEGRPSTNVPRSPAIVSKVQVSVPISTYVGDALLLIGKAGQIVRKVLVFLKMKVPLHINENVADRTFCYKQ